MNKHLYVDVHILQDIPPSNINRDDNGTPKQAIYGGANRLRVSSQAWKRATRLAFQDSIDKSQLGVRTRQFVKLISEELKAKGVDPVVADRVAAGTSAALGITVGKKETNLAYLLFFGRPQVDEIVRRILDRIDVLAQLDGAKLAEEAKAIDVKEILGTGHSLDVALFGRMVADFADLNVDAAVQVAHSLSTHAAQTDFDYFTAVDDVQEASESGAGMISSVEFNSATLYRYATVGVHQLLENLTDPDATVNGVVEFIRAFVLSMPTGHKTSFAPQTRPGFVSVIIREDQPVNLVSAFEEPVFSDKGTFEPSMIKLGKFVNEEADRWGDVPLATVATYRTPAQGSDSEHVVQAFGPSLPFSDLLTSVERVVRDWLATAERIEE